MLNNSGGIVPMLIIGQSAPLIYLAGGIYLITSGEIFYRFSYPEGSCDINATEEKFLLYLKMLGVFLVVKYVPDFLKGISGAILAISTPAYLSPAESRVDVILRSIASGLWGVLVGVYLAKDGRWVARLAFKSNR